MLTIRTGAAYSDLLRLLVSLVVLHPLVFCRDHGNRFVSAVTVFVVEIQTFNPYISEAFKVFGAKSRKQHGQEFETKCKPANETNTAFNSPLPANKLLQFANGEDSSRIVRIAVCHTLLNIRSDSPPKRPIQNPVCLSFVLLFSDWYVLAASSLAVRCR